jgi:hypothetical protein
MQMTQFFALSALVGLATLGIGQIRSATYLRASTFQAELAQPTVRLESGSILYAKVTKTVDAKKAKIGDPVSAVLVADVLAHGKIVVRHGVKLLGHVTEAQIHSKDIPESRLGIAFDKVITKKGEVPFDSQVLAIRPAERVNLDAPRWPYPMSNSAQGPMQGHHASPQGYEAPHRAISSLDPEMKSHDQRMPQTGRTDIDGLTLSSPANGAATIVSTRRTVKLESGVKVELRVTGPITRR